MKDKTMNEIKIPPLPEADKIAIVNIALEGATNLLLFTMDTCGFQTHIHGKIIDEKSGRKFTLKFDLIKE